MQQNPIQVVDENAVAMIFPPPLVQPVYKAVNKEHTLLKTQTRAAVMKREYDQKLEQTRQQTQRYLLDEEARESKRFRDTKMQLIQGNETIIREVDQILLTQAQEKQLAKEKIFVDYEMNTFIPIHQAIQQTANENYETRRLQKITQHYDFASHSKKPGTSLENINENDYNPFQVTQLKATCKINDPVERANKIKLNEDAVVENIEKLTGAKQAQFVGVQNKIKDLQNGVVKAQPINKQREIIDVKKWSNIQDVMVIPDLKKIDAAAGKKIERQPPPFALDE
ncbi:Conserved_hypothetical protein [Hexamita inflata]|uniref:Uncharacterized protein n=1 Tax=Hexamita inflata TaxID=28002 RepID=A0ABP1LLH0_9EUKA